MTSVCTGSHQHLFFLTLLLDSCFNSALPLVFPFFMGNISPDDLPIISALFFFFPLLIEQVIQGPSQEIKTKQSIYTLHICTSERNVGNWIQELSMPTSAAKNGWSNRLAGLGEQICYCSVPPQLHTDNGRYSAGSVQVKVKINSSPFIREVTHKVVWKSFS